MHHHKGAKSKRADELPWNKERVSKKRQREQASQQSGSLDLEPLESLSRSGDSLDGRSWASLDAPECAPR